MTRIATTILIIFALSCSAVFGQSMIPIPASNATWTMDFQVELPFQNVSHNPRYFKSRNDTLINGLHYTIIDQLNDPVYYCLLRQDSAKYYCTYAGDTTEFLLYDFTLQAGDTAHLPIGGTYMDFVVTAVDSILIGNHYHKRIRIPGNYGVDNDFIEGIGSMQGLFYNEVPWVDWWANLSCFSRNDTIFAIDGSGTYSLGNCWQTVSITPNPAQDIITIAGTEVKQAELYDISGRRLLECACNSIDLQAYNEGVYILKVTDFNNSATVLKVLKSGTP